MCQHEKLWKTPQPPKCLLKFIKNLLSCSFKFKFFYLNFQTVHSFRMNSTYRLPIKKMFPFICPEITFWSFSDYLMMLEFRDLMTKSTFPPPHTHREQTLILSPSGPFPPQNPSLSHLLLLLHGNFPFCNFYYLCATEPYLFTFSLIVFLGCVAKNTLWLFE